MKKWMVWVAALGLLGSLPVTPAHAGKGDFALLDMEPTVADTSVQCGARVLLGAGFLPAAFTLHITMTNRNDSGLGGVNGFVRVTYKDLDFVDYAIPVNTTLQISLAGGGTLDTDDIIKVTAGTSGAILIGQASLFTNEKNLVKPLAVGDGTFAFCTTSPASPAPF